MRATVCTRADDRQWAEPNLFTAGQSSDPNGPFAPNGSGGFEERVVASQSVQGVLPGGNASFTGKDGSATWLDRDFTEGSINPSRGGRRCVQPPHRQDRRVRHR